MFPEPEKQKTYPGRRLVQALQLGLVVAIGAVIVMSSNQSETPSIPEPTVAPYVVSATEAPYIAPTAVPDNGIDDLYDRAWTAHDVGDNELAIELYTQVLELDPDLSSAWLGRAVAYAESGLNPRASRNDFWRYVQNMETERIEQKITVNQSLTLYMAEGRVYALSLKAEAGDQIDITAKSVVEGDPGDKDVVDPLVLLFDPKYDLLEVDDDTLRSNGTLINMDAHLEDYEVTEDGTYTLLVTHAGGGSEGKIELEVNVR